MLLILVVPIATIISPVTSAAAQQSSGQVTVAGHSFSVQYSITGGSVNGMSTDPSMPSLLVNVSATASGTLTIQIPRSLLDAKTQGGSSDDDFLVFVDDVPSTDFNQVSVDSKSRTLAIPFDQTVQTIEIIGTVMPALGNSSGGASNGHSGAGVNATPEFGAGTVTTALLSVAIVGVIAASRYSRFSLP
jgi:hypothetical protein